MSRLHRQKKYLGQDFRHGRSARSVCTDSLGTDTAVCLRMSSLVRALVRLSEAPRHRGRLFRLSALPWEHSQWPLLWAFCLEWQDAELDSSYFVKDKFSSPARMSVFLAAIVLIFTIPDSAACKNKDTKKETKEKKIVKPDSGELSEFQTMRSGSPVKWHYLL